jgi:hypothetical protein
VRTEEIAALRSMCCERSVPARRTVRARIVGGPERDGLGWGRADAGTRVALARHPSAETPDPGAPSDEDLAMARRRTRPRTTLAALLWLAVWAGTAAGTAPGSEDAIALRAALALRNRLDLPGGAQLLLRREYRAMFRSLMTWGDGLLLERAYLASGSPRTAFASA